ncbi:tricarboxylic transporter [Mergibacter septicus]|uniref:tripartite tricarboxylate transporter TctB family protein n=1 Tax=Mergibacter septicus TaxID=221402 RepID=UPI00117902BD|nr:tripartite tricarboxylate transporter TctB family protein [Mergibacter septicus]AWX14536.1 tricarboxylic transporter [Mergibacter septicus]
MQQIQSERIFGILIVLLAITYGIESFNFQAAFIENNSIGPQTFPQIIAYILGLSGLWITIKPDQSLSWGNTKIWFELMLTIITLIFYAVLLETLGFILTSILCCGFLSYRMGASWQKAFSIACLYSCGLFLLFNFVLELSLPLGIFGVVQ